MVEWLKGTALRPCLDLLDVDEKAAFLESYQAEIGKAYPQLGDGTVLLPFSRLFLVAGWLGGYYTTWAIAPVSCRKSTRRRASSFEESVTR